MKRVVLLAVFVTVPALAAAQVPPPPPPPASPVVAPAPPVPVQTAPLPAPAPMPRVVVAPTVLDRADYEDYVRSAIEAARAVDVDAVRRAAEVAAQSIDMQAIREASERAREEGERVREQAEWARQDMFRLREMPEFHFDFQNRPMMAGMPMQDSESSTYSSGLSMLQNRQYDQAIIRFDRAIAQKGAHADGAWYWKAFAQYKSGKTEDAIASINSLRKDYPQSRYLEDAKKLEADVRKPRPETIDDDEIKLLAIQGIQNSDPVKAAQLCENILAATNSLKVKRQALYVLALSDQPRAHEVLLNYAKGGGNPDLQREAINYLATRRNKQQPTTSNELKQIYESTSDPAIKRAIIDAYRSTGDKPALMTVASTTGAPIDIRQQAVRNLTDLAVPQDLWTLYQKEENKDLRMSMTRAFSSMGAVDQLLQIAKSDKDPEVRRQAVRSLGNQKVEKTGTTLVDMYGTETDKDNKMAIISALANQNNDTALIALARKETKDLDLKRELVRRIAEMSRTSKAAADYLLEVIK